MLPHERQPSVVAGKRRGDSARAQDRILRRLRHRRVGRLSFMRSHIHATPLLSGQRPASYQPRANAPRLLREAFGVRRIPPLSGCESAGIPRTPNASRNRLAHMGGCPGMNDAFGVSNCPDNVASFWPEETCVAAILRGVAHFPLIRGRTPASLAAFSRA
jgi:hypothetical protein